MPPKVPLLQYKLTYVQLVQDEKIDLYEDGTVKVQSIEWDECEEDEDDYEDLIYNRTLKLTPEKIDGLIERIVQTGFFDMKRRYHDPRVFDGIEETVTLNYKGKSNTVTCENSLPDLNRGEYDNCINDLRSLAHLEPREMVDFS
jgi:hypothetical protein